MRLGLLTTSFPRSEDDVPGSFVRGFARALVARGHQLEVLAPAPHERRYHTPPQEPNLTLRWLRYLSPRALQRTFYGAGVLDNLRAAPWTALGLAPFTLALAAEMRARRSRWDAVISHWALPSALIAGELRGTRPHLAVFHSADVFALESLHGRVQRALATRIAHNATSLLFSSRDLRRRFLALLSPLLRAELAARAHVCPMGVEPAEQTQESRADLRNRLGLDRFTVLSLGRLITLKGIDHAIEACAALPDSELLICGDGPARAALEHHARLRGVPARFLGNQFGAHKAALMRAADVFVLPSIALPSGRTEGMPQTLLEAMEHGLPVVASDVGGICDVVRDHENGLLVPPADGLALRRALMLVREPARREALSRGARSTAALYHWSALAPMIESLLLESVG